MPIDLSSLSRRLEALNNTTQMPSIRLSDLPIATPDFGNTILVSRDEVLAKAKKETNTMPCDCPSCKRDNILNGTLVADCACCSTKLDALTPFQIMGDKSLVCEKCVTEHYVMCANCQKLHKKSDTKEVKNENGDKVVVCTRCFAQYYRECSCCHGYFDRHNVMAHQDFIFCKPCFNKSFQVCSHCNGIHKAGTITKTIRGDRPVCDPCYNFYGPVQVYESKPKLEFQGRPPHYYGIELECELANQEKQERGAKAEEVQKLLGDFVVLKEDGSLRCGFEICTQPASLEEHKIRWEPFFKALPTNLVSFNSANNNCGLHVHCSKKPLSLLTIAKIVVFVNDEKNAPFIEAIAGRRPNNYFQLAKKKHSTVQRIPKGQLSRSDRYEAVNLVNRDTIEFRIFKGTLKKESLFKAIEFCDALIHFCMMGNYGINYCREMDNFVAYVGLRAKDYPHLYAFICAKILRKETKLTQQFGFSVPNLKRPEPPRPAAPLDNSQVVRDTVEPERTPPRATAPAPNPENDNQI
jgi:hypothetical protein